MVGEDEEFDSGCLCVATIDNNANDGGGCTDILPQILGNSKYHEVFFL